MQVTTKQTGWKKYNIICFLARASRYLFEFELYLYFCPENCTTKGLRHQILSKSHNFLHLHRFKRCHFVCECGRCHIVFPTLANIGTRVRHSLMYVGNFNYVCNIYFISYATLIMSATFTLSPMPQLIFSLPPIPTCIMTLSPTSKCVTYCIPGHKSGILCI